MIWSGEAEIAGVAISPQYLTAERAADLVRNDERNRCQPNNYQNIARRFVAHLVASGAAPVPVETLEQIARAALRIDYEDYLVRQRGLSTRTIYHSWRFADRFLDHRFGDGETYLSVISAGDAVSFLQHLLGRKGPYRDKTAPTHLRTFFQYLFQRGVTETNLALRVPTVAQRWDAGLPRFLSPEQIEALLAWVRDNPKHGLRDHAILLIMARLGLRAPEVIVIQLEDIDLRAGELLVRGKGQRHDHLPVPPDVGEAIAAYIRQERISASRTLFVSLWAPNRPFKNGQVINTILQDAFAAIGLTPPGPCWIACPSPQPGDEHGAQRRLPCGDRGHVAPQVTRFDDDLCEAGYHMRIFWDDAVGHLRFAESDHVDGAFAACRAILDRAMNDDFCRWRQ